MPDAFAAIPLLLAQNAPPANPAAGSGGGLSSTLPFIAVICLWGYFLLIRPQQQQEKKRKAMINALKKNDKVLTTAGIYGTVVSVDGEQDRVVIRVDDDKGVKIPFSKSAVAKVLDVAPEKAANLE
jgi:preprotein translocase subunit YajC